MSCNAGKQAKSSVAKPAEAQKGVPPPCSMAQVRSVKTLLVGTVVIVAIHAEYLLPSRKFLRDVLLNCIPLYRKQPGGSSGKRIIKRKICQTFDAKKGEHRAGKSRGAFFDGAGKGLGRGKKSPKLQSLGDFLWWTLTENSSKATKIRVCFCHGHKRFMIFSPGAFDMDGQIR